MKFQKIQLNQKLKNNLKKFLIINIMFGKIEYKLLIENYMTKDEYKKLIEEYMDKYTISYANATQLIMSKQIDRFEKDFDTTYEKAFIQAYDDMNYNISTV